MDFIQTLILKCSERVWNCRFHLFFMKYSNDVIKLSNILKTNPKLTLTIQYQVLFQINNKRWRSSFLQSKEIEKEYSIATCLRFWEVQFEIFFAVWLVSLTAISISWNWFLRFVLTSVDIFEVTFLNFRSYPVMSQGRHQVFAMYFRNILTVRTIYRSHIYQIRLEIRLSGFFWVFWGIMWPFSTNTENSHWHGANMAMKSRTTQQKFVIDYDAKRIRSISVAGFDNKIQNWPSLKKIFTLNWPKYYKYSFVST